MRRPLANAICAMCASCFCATPKCCAFPRTGLQCAQTYFLFEKTYRQPAGAWRVQDFGTGTISILLTACQGAAIQFPQQIFSLYGLALGRFCPPCSISYRGSYFPKHPLLISTQAFRQNCQCQHISHNCRFCGERNLLTQLLLWITELCMCSGFLVLRN